MFTFREVPAVRGIPDLVAVRFDPEVVATRAELDIRSLSSDVEVRVVQALRKAGPVEVGELADQINLTRDYLRRSVLPMLEQLGWVTTVAGTVNLQPGTKPVGRRVVTVEAKLRDWLRAFNQARNQLYSADAAYIALDEATAATAVKQVDAIAERGIGVITVNAESGRHRVLVRPKRVLDTKKTAVGRELIAERSFGLWQAGERAGQVSPVFGWYLPTAERQLL
ncbi:hypothetical protein [Leifsonia aquatica]|uniref:hypothetical protein n=1 Tax=Leifsonia aquatica TaxID=144185 RepID=UPI003805A80C